MKSHNELSNENAILIGYVLIIFAIIFFGIAFTYLFTDQTKYNQQKSNNTVADSNLIIKNKFSAQDLDNNNYIKECIKIADKDNCIFNYALEQKNLSFCNYISESLLNIKCLNETIKIMNQEKLNLDACFENSNESNLNECKKLLFEIYINEIIPKDFCLNNQSETLNTNQGNYNLNCYDTYIFENEFKINTKEFNCNKFTNENYILSCNKYKEGEIKFLDLGIEDFCDNLIFEFKSLCKQKFIQKTFNNN